MTDREQTIREAAYYKWDAAGRPEGRELDFWAEAEREQSGTSTAAILESIPMQASPPVPAAVTESTAPVRQSVGTRKQKTG